jgi:nucleoid DNA-binding protein
MNEADLIDEAAEVLPSRRAARKPRNPRTGEEIEVETNRVRRFVPAEALKRAVNDAA